MTLHVPETNFQEDPSAPGRRRNGPDDHLILSELNPHTVVDSLDNDDAPLNLITFGSVREVCPKCKQHLKLVLCQTRVRIAHLLCSGCESCFDAHYENGTPALTI